MASPRISLLLGAFGHAYNTLQIGLDVRSGLHGARLRSDPDGVMG